MPQIFILHILLILSILFAFVPQKTLQGAQDYLDRQDFLDMPKIFILHILFIMSIMLSS
jgi:hypothetical protein